MQICTEDLLCPLCLSKVNDVEFEETHRPYLTKLTKSVKVEPQIKCISKKCGATFNVSIHFNRVITHINVSMKVTI